MAHSTLRAVVHGRVQGVCFRASAREQAAALGLSGWVRNLLDGTVDVYAVGSSQSLDRFRAWLQTGPPGARVTQVETQTGEVDAAPSGFEIRV